MHVGRGVTMKYQNAHVKTVDELIEALDELRNEVPGDSPVYLVSNPSYPHSETLSTIVSFLGEPNDPPELTGIYLSGGGVLLTAGVVVDKLKAEGWR